MDMSQVVEYGQSMTFLGSIGGLALALLGAGCQGAQREEETYDERICATEGI